LPFVIHDLVVMPNDFHWLITLKDEMTIEKAARLVP
jgi:REP element-mobilizing transposase RayT